MTTARRPFHTLLVAVTVLSLVATAAPLAQAVQDRLPTGPPIPNTARILDGNVYGIDRTGDTVVVVGDFTTARDFDGSDERTRLHVLAFDLSTGDVSTSFAPVVDDVVHAVHIDDDGSTVLIAGEFRTVNGVAQRGVARLSLADASLDPTWRGTTSAAVLDMAVTDDEVILAGRFEWAGNIRRPLLAALDPETGLGIPSFDITLSGILTPNATNRARQTTQAIELDVTEDGRWLAVLGNHTHVEGLPRAQVALLDLADYSVADWHAPRLAEWPCYAGSAVNALTYVTHVDFSPDGTHLVLGSKLAWGGGADNDALCDAVARFEAPAGGAIGTGTDLEPSWVTYAGIDSVYRVEVTESAVYVGGHFRWLNTPYLTTDGAVARPGGLAALDPLTGVPLSWTPDVDESRPVRGYEAMLADGELLLLGRDGAVVGGELRQRVAGFSSVGGPTNPAPEVTTLPAALFVKTTDDVVRRATFDGTSFTPFAAVSGPGVDAAAWGYADDGFLQHGQLVTFGQDAASYYARPFEVGAVGPVTNLSRTAGYAQWSAGGDQPDDQPRNVDATRAAAYLDGRIIYTRAGSTDLFWRHYSIESGIIGGEEFVLEGDGDWWDQVRALTVIDGRLYAAWSTGWLFSWGLTSSVRDLSISELARTVDDGAAGIDWSAVETMFSAAPTDTRAPTTAFTAPVEGAVTAGAVTLAGTAADDRRVAAVDVTVRDTGTGLYLQPDGTMGAAAATLTPITMAAGSGSVDWTLDVVLPDGSFVATAVATDGAGNQDPTGATRSFGVTSVEPDSTITTPAAGAVVAPGTVTVGGQASHPVHGVSAVGVTVRDRDTLDWLQPDGSFASSFARVEATLAQPGAATTGWSLDVELPVGRWAVTARAVSGDGGLETATPYSRFATETVVVDDVEPDSVITTPATAAVVASPVTISGTATDDSSGVTEVLVTVRSRTTKDWLQPDGSFAAAFALVPASLATPGATSTDWSLAVVLPPDDYATTSRAVDAGGTTETTRPWVPFQVQ